MIRSSEETDRTRVSSGVYEPDHLDPLEEKRTNMSNVRDGHQEPRQNEGAVEGNNDHDVRRYREGDSKKDLELGDAKGETPKDEGNGEKKDPNLIEWDGPDDPENPLNWKPMKKWIICMALGFMTLCVTFASSVFSNATIPTAKLYHVSTEVTTLGTSVFVLGFAVGPLIWGPASEVFGRKKPLFLGYFIFAIFQIPVAVAQNLYTIIICRFIGGACACAPLAIVGGAFVDFFGPVDRAYAICVFAAATFLGPIFGPILGGFITQSYLGWRWTAWITLIMAALFGTIGFFIYPESAHPAILQARAKKLRYQTKNWAIHAKADETQIDFKSLLEKYFLRPFVMLVQEPILLLITIYLALIYGILYLFFEAFPISYQEERGWNQGVGALPFIGIMIGVLLGGATISYTTATRFKRKLEEHGKVIPEERLPPMILGAFILPIGLFWFAWTSSPHITWVPQVISGIPIGWGILMIFMQGLNYIIDVYLWHANSAIAANTLLRSLAGGGFPLFAVPMYHTLGVPWATSLLAFLCVAMIPAPILFFIYGEKIRRMSKYSPTA